jgi:neutral ceramidase
VYEVGRGKADITCYQPGTELLGWAMPHNRAEGVAMPLSARAIAFRHAPTGQTAVLVTCELGFIAHSLVQGVTDALGADHAELGVTERNLVLAATHTHSGPGGFSHDLLYTLSTPGYCEHVYTGIVAGITRAVVDAVRSLRPASLTLARGRFPLSVPVCFNRSTPAFNRNPDVAPSPFAQRDLATDREMTLLLARDLQGRPLASINWFAVHGTSIHAENRLIHPDNKGFAAELLEAWGRGEGDPDYVGAFAQESAGDVTPNFRWSARRHKMIGASDDDFESARVSGAFQFDLARRLHDDPGAPEVSGPIDAAIDFIDFRDFEVSPDFTGGIEGRRTGFARVGMPFMEGTAEGPGPLRELRFLNRGLSAAVRARKELARRLGWHPDGALDSHGPMYPFLETGAGGDGRAFGAFQMGNPVLPGWFDPVVAEVHRMRALGGVSSTPWTDNVMPIQIVQIGPLALAALPNEPTTVSGRRLRALLLQELAPRGVEHVVIAGYANAYSGYLTTFEEYQAQLYEGGCTQFGQWSLAAYQTAFRALARRMAAPTALRPPYKGPRPYRVPRHELDARRHEVASSGKAWFR